MAPPRPTIDDVYRTLRDRICHLDLQPGARLTEQALAEELGVSRTPIRRVLDWLERDGLVTQSPGSSATVATVDLKQLREVYALRIKVAELVAEFVRLPPPDPMVDDLQAIRAGLADVSPTEPQRLGPVYDAYHDLMLDVLDNGPLRRIHDQLYRQTARVWLQLLPDLDFDAEVEAVRGEIDETIAAVKEGSAAALAEVRQRYLHQLLGRLNAYLALPFAPTR